MTLRELMDQFSDETWFAATTPDGEELPIWNADYIGGHPDAMPWLEPLLDREIGPDVTVETRRDPENPYVFNAPDVPVVCVGLLKTEEEKEECE